METLKDLLCSTAEMKTLCIQTVAQVFHQSDRNPGCVSTVDLGGIVEGIMQATKKPIEILSMKETS